jgi:hypothetical protein
VTVLNGHIHQVMQKVEGNVTFHTARGTAIELHVWRSAERSTFATFVYQRSSERLVRYFTGWDENEVICQPLKW